MIVMAADMPICGGLKIRAILDRDGWVLLMARAVVGRNGGVLLGGFSLVNRPH